MTAFASTLQVVRWPLPIAAFELENKQPGEWAGYSLWKLLCLRTLLRVIFAYRRDS